MKIVVKTVLITLEVEDNPLVVDKYTVRALPEMNISIKSVIDEAIKLHKVVSSETKVTN